MRRFHWKRKRAALVLLPATAMLFVSGLAAAQTVPTPATPQDEAVASGGRAESVVRVRARRHVMAGETVRIVGRATPGAGRWVTVRIAGKKARTVRTRKKGGFRVRWQAPHAGIYRVTAIVRGTERARRARSRSRTINAYRSAEASYYGPGLYGHGTACGRTLTASTVGVANKTLPCGTRVRFRYRGRSVVAPVIDRGPYAGNREWDLTAALKAKLGFGAVGRVLSTR